MPTICFVTCFEKITVAQDFELRKTIRGVGGKYVSSRTTWPRSGRRERRPWILLKGLKGMTSLAYTASDPVALAKALTSYAKTNPRWCSRPDGRGPGDRDQIHTGTG